MKATELRLGDWVYDCFLKANTKVEELSPLMIKGDINTRPYAEDDFTPIPVTPEILLKNGWELKAGYYVLKDRNARIGWQPNGDAVLGYSLFPRRIHNIHELQHLIADCGMEKDIEL